MTNQPKNESEAKEQRLTFAEFLKGTPPNQKIEISDLVDRVGYYYGDEERKKLKQPEIQLHCDNDVCNGIRFFRCIERECYLTKDIYKEFYLEYICSNCRKTRKMFSLAAIYSESDSPHGICFKFGEVPPYGPPVSAKLIKLIGPDRDDFLKGRQSENLGLGVGAFTYYRRVVENQKNRILEKIIEVSNKIKAPQEKIDQLKAALDEGQFSKAMTMAKEAIPESLLIEGHSPMQLLHSALSDGLHSQTDEHCLELAHSIRVVLGELSDKLSNALKNEAEIKKALTILMNESKDTQK